MPAKPRYPGIRVTCNGNQLVTQHVETRITEGGVFYPITPSTEGGEIYQQSYAQGRLNVWGQRKIAVETEGEHAAQGGATAFSVSGRRTVNFTSGQGIVYAVEQYYHAPGKFSTMVLEVGARALTKHALNVHCGHDDFYAALDTGWTMLIGKDAQQAADQAIILRKVNELALNPGMNIQDGMLTTHLERTFFAPEAELLREFLGAADDIIDCPTPAQRELFGPKRRRVPADDGPEEPDPARAGAEPGAPHERRGRAPQQFQRAHPAASSKQRLRRVRPADRPPLRPRHANTRPRTPTRCSSRSAARRTTSRRPAITCASSATPRSARSTSTSSARSPRPPSSTRCAARRTSSSSSAPTKAGGRQPARARHPRRARQGAAKSRSSAARCRRSRRTRRRASSAALRHRLARLPPRAHARRLRVRHRRDRARKDGRSAADGETLLRARRRSSVRRHQQGHAVAAARRAPSPCASIPSAAGA